MSSAGAIPALRLVSARQPGGWRLPSPPHRTVTAENHAAAAASDPRWVLAVRAAGLLQGGRAAFLSPQRRRRLNALASRLGLRPFDASLVIAIVQDAARAGLDPLGPDTHPRLRLIPAPARPATPWWMLLGLSAALGAAFFAVGVQWLTLR